MVTAWGSGWLSLGRPADLSGKPSRSRAARHVPAGRHGACGREERRPSQAGSREAPRTQIRRFSLPGPERWTDGRRGERSERVARAGPSVALSGRSSLDVTTTLTASRVSELVARRGAAARRTRAPRTSRSRSLLRIQNSSCAKFSGKGPEKPGTSSQVLGWPTITRSGKIPPNCAVTGAEACDLYSKGGKEEGREGE